MEFEIKRKDFAGRIGKLSIGKHEVETPTISPVVNPNLQALDTKRMKEMGAQILITNSYIIYKNEELRKKAVNEGLHDLIGFDGPIMTDSGAYQLSVYGDVDVSSREIIDFQKKIGSDIIVPLDIPTSPQATKEEAKKDVEVTLERLKAVDRSEKNFAGPIQGSRFCDVRAESAMEVGDMDFDLFCIGGVVPMMESYEFEQLSEAIVASKKNLPLNSPVHLFGAGHPMTLALAVLLGCDLFDSAAYALFAKRGRYLTNRGTWDIEEMKYLPCNCPVCEENNLDRIKDSKEDLAAHNLYITFEEINTIKEAIRRGELFELASERARAHPEMITGLRMALERGREFFEELAPRSKKSAFFYQGEESLLRPEVVRNKNLILEMEFDEDIVLFSKSDIEINRKDVEIMMVKPPFVYPKELNRTYPFGQSLIADINQNKRLKTAKNTIKDFIEEKKNNFKEIKTVGDLTVSGIENLTIREVKQLSLSS